MTSDTAAERTDLEPVGRAVHQRVHRLQRGYLATPDDRDAVATLARLRAGAGKLPEDTPELWGLTCDPDDYVQPDWPEWLWRRADTAAHIALTLYALHQQSRREEGMHRPPEWVDGRRRDRDLGRAVRALMPPGELHEPLRRHLVHAGTATSVSALAHRLRGIVRLLRRGAVPLDYGLLADQLFTAQRPGGMSEVRRSWGRGFTAYRPAGAGENETTPNDDA